MYVPMEEGHVSGSEPPEEECEDVDEVGRGMSFASNSAVSSTRLFELHEVSSTRRVAIREFY